MNVRVLAAGLTAAVAIALAGAPLSGQAPHAKPTARTAWGHPDLTGVWTNDTFTPLQRPTGLGAKEFFTPEEAEQLSRALRSDGVDPLATGAFAELASGKPSERLQQSREDIHYDNALWLTETRRKGIASLRTSLIYDPPTGRIPPMTPEAQKRESARAAAMKGHTFDSAETRPLSERCIIWPHEGPPLLPAPYNANLEIFQTPAYVVVVQEMNHNARIIPVDGRPTISPAIRQLSGDSRGRWEGETLVVESANFTDRTRFQGSTETLRVIERFTRIDADTIDYRFTVEDPNTWTRPWSAAIPLTRFDSRIFEFACHEGNHDLTNILRVARTLDAK